MQGRLVCLWLQYRRRRRVKRSGFGRTRCSASSKTGARQCLPRTPGSGVSTLQQLSSWVERLLQVKLELLRDCHHIYVELTIVSSVPCLDLSEDTQLKFLPVGPRPSSPAIFSRLAPLETRSLIMSTCPRLGVRHFGGTSQPKTGTAPLTLAPAAEACFTPESQRRSTRRVSKP